MITEFSHLVSDVLEIFNEKVPESKSYTIDIRVVESEDDMFARRYSKECIVLSLKTCDLEEQISVAILLVLAEIPFLYIGDMWLPEFYRGRNIGTMLVQKMIDYIDKYKLERRIMVADRSSEIENGISVWEHIFKKFHKADIEFLLY